LKQIIKSYEDRNISITELERKIREKQAKHEKELKELDSKYKDKLKYLNKKLKHDESSMKNLLTKENNTTDVTMDKNQLTDRALVRNTSHVGITERKKDENSSSNLYKKKNLSSKKLSENMKNIIEDLKSKKDVSFLTKRNVEKEVSEDLTMNHSNVNAKDKNDYVKAHGRTDSMKNIDANNNSKLLLSKINHNKHTRNCSFDKTKPITHGTVNKNIHALKENFKSNPKLAPSQTLTPSMLAAKNVTPPSYIPTGNVIVNQNAVPCFNNINIYTSNMNNFKTNEINLKQYIVNKINGKSKIGKQTHSRTASTTANH